MIIGIGIGLGFQNGGGRQPPRDLLCEAVARHVCVAAKDGDLLLKLAPHIVYKRGKKEIRTVDAVIIERNGRPINHAIMRSYATGDLTEIVITDDGFTVHPDFDPQELEYSRGTFCVLESGDHA